MGATLCDGWARGELTVDRSAPIATASRRCHTDVTDSEAIRPDQIRDPVRRLPIPVG